ncbi:MAG TPA: ribosomal-processing cysteine protease Prp [Bacillota bacterium]|nr:ribosomal-processing cysteine protease Prp [Bacillota bacterium]
MTTVTVRRSCGHVVRFRVQGHSGWAEYGHDIVCSAVSALTTAAANGLRQQAGVSRSVRQRHGELDCMIVGSPSDSEWNRADAILETMLAGIRSIAREYPGTISIVEKNRPESGRDLQARGCKE